MKLKTSFFNFRVLLKNLTRFAPLWVLYTVAEVLCLMTLNLNNPAGAANDLGYIMGPVSLAHMVYGLLVAACLFGDLLDARLCNGLHAMPMRREGWLLTNLASGFVFALLPAVVGGAIGAIALQEHYWIALVWQLTSLLQFVFFFGLAVFCAMCTGKRLAMVAMYAIVNFFSELIYWVASIVYEPLLPGVTLSTQWFRLFCPVETFTGNKYLSLDEIYSDGVSQLIFHGYNLGAWYYLFICAAIGVVFLFFSWRLYRKRHLETAGDFISFRPMRIFFLLSYSFAVGALVYTFMDSFLNRGTDYTFLAVGIIIGWFTGWMLLERTAKIFTQKVILGFIAFAVLFAGSIGLTSMDPLGITTYVPETQQIEKAAVYFMSDRIGYESSDGWSGRYVTEPAEIAQVQALHRQMMGSPAEENDETVVVYVRYEMANGFQVVREYFVPAESAAAKAMAPYLSDVRSVFSVNDWQQVKDTVEMAQMWCNDKGDIIDIFDDAQLQGLLDAIEADCKAGNLAQHDNLHKDEAWVAGIDIAWGTTWHADEGNTTRGAYVVIYENCENVLAFMETLK